MNLFFVLTYFLLIILCKQLGHIPAKHLFLYKQKRKFQRLVCGLPLKICLIRYLERKHRWKHHLPDAVIDFALASLLCHLRYRGQAGSLLPQTEIADVIIGWWLCFQTGESSAVTMRIFAIFGPFRSFGSFGRLRGSRNHDRGWQAVYVIPMDIFKFFSTHENEKQKSWIPHSSLSISP